MKFFNLFLLLFFLITTNSFSKNKEEDKITMSKKEFTEKIDEKVNFILNKISSSKIAEFSKSLLEKEKKINDALKKIEFRRKELEINEKKFTERVRSFNQKQNKIIGCLDNNSKQRDSRVGHLVNIISGMKPQVAAEMLSVQESKLSVEIISKLDPVKVSKIFNLMDKEISARLQKEYLNMQK